MEKSMKKWYQQPKAEVYVVRIQSHLLEGSDGSSEAGNDDGSRMGHYYDDEE